MHPLLAVGKVSLFFLVFLGSLSPKANSVIVLFEIDSQSSIDFTTAPPSFTLTFSDFKKSSTTNTQDVTYNVMANNVARTEDVVLGRLDDLFPNIAFQADFGSYTKKGGNAHLVESQAGYVAVTTQDGGLADKAVDEGDGKLLDGSFSITYQAKALEDLPAGSHYRVLTITFAET